MKQKRLFGALLSVALLVLPALAADKSATEGKLKKLRTQMEALKLKQTSRRAQESSVRAELAQAETAMGIALRALKETRKNLIAARRRMNNLETERKTLVDKRDQARDALAQQIRMAFMTGKDEYWKLLLSQNDPGQLGRMLTYYDYLNRARSAQMQALNEVVGSLADVEQNLRTEVRKLDALKQAQTQESRRLAQLKQQREKALREVLGDIADAGKKLQSMQKDEDELSELLNKVEEVVREVQVPPQRAPKGAGFAQWKGKMGWPARGAIVQQFGEGSHGGRLRANGVLIDTKDGDDVRAVFQGRVVFADWLRGFGLMTIVDHGDSYMSLYGHNQSLNKQLGDWVEAGDVLAQSGSTGGASEGGLYFEIRVQGKAVDPRRWCGKGGG